MRRIFQLALLISALSISGQDIEKELVIEEGYKVPAYGFTDDGSFYFQTNKRMLSSKDKNTTFTKYNSQTLEIDYTYKPDKPFEIIETSPNAEKILFRASKVISFKGNNFNVLDNNGNTKKFKGKDWLPKKFEVIDDFMSKDYFVTIGYDGKIKYKKRENKDYKIFRRDLNTLESKNIDFNLPDVFLDKEDVFLRYQVLEYTDDSFTIIAKFFTDKNEKGKYPRKQKYILATYDYDGNLDKKQIFETKLTDANMKFVVSNAGLVAYKVVEYTYFKDGVLRYRYRYVAQPTASGAVYVDIKKKSYYTYGLVASEKSKYGSGFMLDKFDYDGNKIWSKMIIALPKMKDDDVANQNTSIDLYDLGDKLGLSVNNKKEDFTKIYEFDKVNGEILEEKEFGDYKRYNLNGFGSLDNMHSNEFISSYVFKNNFSKKHVLNMSTVIGYALNEDFKNYIDSLADTKRKLHFISSINNTGIITIQANNKDNEFKLLKFNWNKI